MEKGEEKAQLNYALIATEVPEALIVAADENKHEKELLGLIQEEHLKYMGSIVLGLNDALVEILGTLAGLTFALQNTKLVALVGIITGIAGALSMSSSEYLSNRTDGKSDLAIKSAAFTGIAYIIAVVLLIAPFLVAFQQPDPEKLSAYECGFNAFDDARMKFDVRFYLVAILFIIFDLEVAFLFPWAITLGATGVFAFWSMVVFLGVLTIGFIYEWKKGALEWE